MSQWYCVNLGDALTAGIELDRIERAFAAAFGRRGEPGDMGLFVRHVSEGQLHCDVVVYFTPASADVAGRALADPCPPPSRHGLGLLQGSAEAWRLLAGRDEPPC
ncbi:hypothetical protein QWY84_16725 [Aquisalimonas lutea]|uniref:hypothetical protein n=1 Tax=Aquisalimonas lutea TaxID=1327750 RepID=UPI0025B2E52A|nr:hypothetical protein [Aquisalimonas lutea]MDN3519261.1 hypothetical protein [Aquisalimonas lutea]